MNNLFDIQKYLPQFYYDSVFDIPYNMFLCKNIKALFFDLDNTLLESYETTFNFKTQHLLKKISQIFKVVIISNASNKRLRKILKHDWHYIYLNFFYKKPHSWGFIKALDLVNEHHNKTVMIGDQLHTDILGANKLQIISILVKPLNRNKEPFFTKLKRLLIEKPLIEKVKKQSPLLYKQKFKNFIKLEK
ncbi:MAG: HAD-IA family hydrolase [Weeping tea tree witches'-broom phytoplasma]|uniref:YqeG family HAD IIIA-type phosphatase n=1 Tax=Candidatus Phytoplasma melaleucae TaxID=2982630 RepID=UPI00293B32D9|nr:HAD-IA family hydrolase [Weeping tea tree witches'-broom phytoplasma]